MLEVMASTGMRVSELQCICVDGVRAGLVEIHNKGKIRKVLLTKEMRKQLLDYIRQENIETGRVFLTRKGNPVNRSNIWKEMKQLCDGAGVEKTKVFPHNLRKLFAICLYKVEKNLAKVADILGHDSMETTRKYLMECSKEYKKTLEMVNLVASGW
jgi:site-specific recombinase XerD